jgi:hypothetical protein
MVLGAGSQDAKSLPDYIMGDILRPDYDPGLTNTPLGEGAGRVV